MINLHGVELSYYDINYDIYYDSPQNVLDLPQTISDYWVTCIVCSISFNKANNDVRVKPLTNSKGTDTSSEILVRTLTRKDDWLMGFLTNREEL